jgi:predicted ATP-dependent endonuclease of OLD family
MLRSRASRSRYLTSSTPQTSDAIEICWSSGAEKPRIGASASTYTRPGKKLIFLVTHSPILLEMRTLADLASVVVFSHSLPPERASPWSFTSEEQLKVKQCLPAFHAGQRELLFSNIPIVVEGPGDVSIIMNVATKLALPLGAAGIGITSMGGKYQLLAFRSLLRSFAKPNARFVRLLIRRRCRAWTPTRASLST